MCNDVDCCIPVHVPFCLFHKKPVSPEHSVSPLWYELVKGARLLSIWITCVFVHMDNLMLVHMDNFQYFLSIWTTNLYIWITSDDFCTYGQPICKSCLKSCLHEYHIYSYWEHIDGGVKRIQQSLYARTCKWMWVSTDNLWKEEPQQTSRRHTS